MPKSKKKTTMIELVLRILESDLPTPTRNAIVQHYLLPKSGYTESPIEMSKGVLGSVGRPSAEEIEIENDPKMKAEYQDTAKLMKQVK